MAKFLLVDDDRDNNEIVSACLRKDNHVMDVATTGKQAIEMLDAYQYDAIILDWALPDISGLDVLKHYRKTGQAPVIMLTGKGSIADRELGLDSGADDYLRKPFSARELAARIRALLRRPHNLTSTELQAGEYILHPSELTVHNKDQEIRLTPREFAVLEFLARHPHEIFSGHTLMARIWPGDNDASTESLRTAIWAIRKKLDEGIIETIPVAGYKLGR